MKVKYSKTEAHQRYRLANNDIVSGVTTIIRENLGWNAAALIAWSRKEAMAGRDPLKIKEKAADVGTLAHFMIACHLKGDEPDLSEFSPADVSKAENCFLAFLDWEKKHSVKVAHVERQLVSEHWRYGGTSDFDGEVDGEIAVVDYKSGKDIYLEYKIQGAALAQLYFEQEPFNSPWPKFYVLKLGQDGDFQYAKVSNLEKYWEVFYHCLELHNLKKALKGEQP